MKQKNVKLIQHQDLVRKTAATSISIGGIATTKTAADLQGGHHYNITQEATPGANAWSSINVAVQGYEWCRCEKGKWVCNMITPDVQGMRNILYEVDDYNKPTKWVQSKGRKK